MPSPSSSDGRNRSHLSITLPRCISRARDHRNSFDELYAVGLALNGDEDGIAYVPDGPRSSTNLATFCSSSEGKTASVNIHGTAFGPLSQLEVNISSRHHSRYHARHLTYEGDDVTRISTTANACVEDFAPTIDSPISPGTLLPPLFDDKEETTVPSGSGVTLFGSWNGFDADVLAPTGVAPRVTLPVSAAPPIFDYDDDRHRSETGRAGARLPSCEINGLITPISPCSCGSCVLSVEPPSLPPISMTTDLAPGAPFLLSSSPRHTPSPTEVFTSPSSSHITRLSRDRANSTISAVTSLESALPSGARSKASVAMRRCSTTPLRSKRSNSDELKKAPRGAFSNALLDSFHHLDRRGSLPRVSASTPPEASTLGSSLEADTSLDPTQRGRSNSVISLANLSTVFDYVGRSFTRSLSPKAHHPSTTPERHRPSTRQRTWSFSGAASSILGGPSSSMAPTHYRWEDVVSLSARFCTSSDSTSGLNSFMLGLHDMEHGGKARSWDPRVACSAESVRTSPSISSFSNIEQNGDLDLTFTDRWPRAETSWGEPAQVVVGYVGGSQSMFSPRELTPPQIVDKILNPPSVTFPMSSPRSKI
ncbi:BZ3500_MvSof-1268-A1-R1_Chr3-1g05819 [Microbotryum saponariae]|uniref:BZ3500_MvSof-1268-A1-R1_Chr3-1g05819 protein n=1 Tax=Microbotryum saponariae TaxID=289078 RepID=A0A2X0KY72_9BASI|nr:BZ3500_MvSof-1268-A1-R1_Chr3-1g05819 [Microbotryum saponariae]SDA05009.1 BZ3501_MvSof-1269-A2-R1_Chr3-1g05489 [Microbotryum saponariae]